MKWFGPKLLFLGWAFTFGWVQSSFAVQVCGTICCVYLGGGNGGVDSLRSKYWEQEIQKKYSETQVIILNGDELYDRYLAGDEHSTFLVEKLNFKIEDQTHFSSIRYSFDKKISAPKQLLDLFKKSNELIDEQLRLGKLRVGEEMRPALVFQRTTNSRKELLFVRPGYDPYPDTQSGWALTETQHSMVDWTIAMKDGKLPIAIAMLDHDLGHLTEFLMDPNIARETRLGYERLAKKLASVGFENDTSIQAIKLKARLWQASEFLSLPNYFEPGNVRTVTPLLQTRVTAISLEENRALLSQLSESEFQNLVTAIATTKEKLLTRNGGGIRDSVNELRRVMGHNTRNLQNEINSPWNPDQTLFTFSNPDSRALIYGSETIGIEHLHALLAEIRLLRAFSLSIRGNVINFDVFKAIPKFDRWYTSIDPSRFKNAYLKEKVNQLLRDRVNRFQVAFHNARIYRIQASDVVRESYQETPHPESNVALFFESFTTPDQVSHKIFTP